MKKLVVLMLAVAAVPSLAQTETARPTQKKQTPVQKIDFGDADLIEGGLSGPDVDIYTGHKRPDFDSLLRVRKNFNDKLLESVHEL